MGIVVKSVVSFMMMDEMGWDGWDVMFGGVLFWKKMISV